MNKFKLTPEVYKQLLKISANLTPLQKLDKAGNPLFRQQVKFLGTDIVSGEYQKGDPYKNKFQRGKEPVLINHMVELIDKYQKKGMPAVDEYVEAVNKIAAAYLIKEAQA